MRSGTKFMILLNLELKNYPFKNINTFIDAINNTLEEENSAHRVIKSSQKIVPITDQNELNSINDAIEHPLQEVQEHLKAAVEKLSDREQPDYRNSVKESISAVEALCKRLSGKATLPDALKELTNTNNKNVNLHPAFKEALNKLYGYTSDSSGIRHSLKEKDEPTSYSEAKYMLVVVSAFINYIISQSAEAGIEL